MTRTIWPVGQGAFYTECFQNGNTKFNVVYDCGSYIYGIDNYWRTPSRLLKQINAANLNQVDLLFVSHFHWDHINGIQKLMKNAANARTRLVMPAMSDEVKAYYFLSILIDSGLGDEIVASRANNENREQNPAIQTADFYRNLIWGDDERYIFSSIDESSFFRLEFEKENIAFHANKGVITEDEIKNARENHQRIWTYCVVQFSKKELEDEAIGIIEHINDNAQYNAVQNLSRKDFVLPAEDVWTKVKATYKKTNRSSANNNSLIVLSTPILPFEESSRIEKSICPICCNCCSIKCNRKKCPDCFKSICPSALYTGDREKEVNRTLLFSGIRHPLFCHHIGLYQISHHGHNNEFNQQICLHHPFHRTLAFCCYGKENIYHHPDFRLIKSYCEDGICTIAMDENSKPLVQIIELK